MALVGAIAGTRVAFHHYPPLHVQTRSWNHAYFQWRVTSHPELTAVEAIDHSAWYLMNYQIQVPDYADADARWRWQLVEILPPGSNQPPKWREYWEYLYLLLPVLVGAVGPWLLIHTTAWIVAGFQIGTRSTPGIQILAYLCSATLQKTVVVISCCA